MTRSARNVLIFGGGSGIGAGIARAFCALGDNVTATGGTEAEVQAARQRPDMAGISLKVLDVRDAAAVSTLVSGLGELDVLVNCAGVIRRGMEHDPEVFADVLNINLTGTMRLCTAARPTLAARKGCIVNTASMLSFFGGVPGQSCRALCHRHRIARGRRIPDCLIVPAPLAGSDMRSQNNWVKND